MIFHQTFNISSLDQLYDQHTNRTSTKLDSISIRGGIKSQYSVTLYAWVRVRRPLSTLKDGTHLRFFCEYEGKVLYLRKTWE